MRRLVVPDDLVASSDIADMLHVSRGCVSNWKKRDDSFPDPVATVGNGKIDVYSARDIRDWILVKYPQLCKLMEWNGAT